MNKLMNTKSNKPVSLKVVDGVSTLDMKDGRVFANGGLSVSRGHCVLSANYIRRYG